MCDILEEIGNKWDSLGVAGDEVKSYFCPHPSGLLLVKIERASPWSFPLIPDEPPVQNGRCVGRYTGHRAGCRRFA